MDKLRYWEDLLNSYGVLDEIGRWIGWALIKGIKFIADMAETLVNEVYKLLDFTSYAGIGKFFNTREVKILLWILIVFSLLVIAWNLLFNSKEYKPKIKQQVFIMMIVLCLLPQIFTFLNTVTIQAKDFMQGGQGTNLSDQIIADGITDLKYIDDKGFNNYVVTDNIAKGKNGQTKNGFTSGKEKNVNYITPTEVITKDSDINTKDILLNRIVTTDDGNLVVEEIKEDKKFLGLIDATPWYYRYHIDFLSIFLCLTATIIAFFFTAWKVAKIIFELAFHHLLAVFMSASDLSSGQRIKTVFKSLGSIYVVLMLLPVLMKLFALAQTYVGQNISNGFVKGFVLIALAFAMVDGPNVVERVLGVDAGIKSGFQTLASTFMIARSSHALAKGAGRAVSAVGGAVAGGAMGFGQAARESYQDIRNSGSQNNQNEVSNGGINQQMQQNANSQNNLQENSQQNDNVQTAPLDNGGNGEINGNSTQQNIINDSMNLPFSPTTESNSIADGVNTPSAEAQNTEPHNSAGISNDNRSGQAEPKQGISDSVKKNLEGKGINSPIPNRRNGIQFNPNSIAGTAQRSYHSAHSVGGAVGGVVGKVGGKIANKTSIPKSQPPEPIQSTSSKQSTKGKDLGIKNEK